LALERIVRALDDEHLAVLDDHGTHADDRLSGELSGHNTVSVASIDRT
jgi:hypothetical protein